MFKAKFESLDKYVGLKEDLKGEKKQVEKFRERIPEIRDLPEGAKGGAFKLRDDPKAKI